ncbi:MAG: hypothetical protein V3T58_04635 [Candidatus Hydrothermarchaeales archaeon]
MIKVEKKKVDSHGRISIPISWRKKALGGSRDVIVIELEDRVEVLPENAGLEKYIDAIEIELKDFSDYHLLKKELRKSVE